MSDSRTMNEYAAFIEATTWYKHAFEGNAKEFAYLEMGLSGESGEFSDELKKIVREIGFDDQSAFAYAIRDPETRKKLIFELGDTLWYVIQLARVLGLDLQQVIVFNTYKLYTRYVEQERIDPKETPWPFSNPMLSLDNVKNALTLMEANDVRFHEKVRP